jgi:hypothetical protein
MLIGCNNSVVRQKFDLRRTFYFDTRTHPEYVNLSTYFQIAHAHQYITVRLKWKTALTTDGANRNLAEMI